VEERFGLEGGEAGSGGKDPGEQAGHVGSGEAAASDFLFRAAAPGDFDILTARGEFDEVTAPRKESVGLVTLGESGGNDGGEITGPLTLEVILVVAGGDDVTAADVGAVDPIFVLQDVVFATATKAAIQDVIASFQGLASAFANDEGARAELIAENAETADFGFGRDLADNSGNSRAVSEDIGTVSGRRGDLEAVVEKRQIIGQLQTVEQRVGRFDAGIEHGDFDAAPCALPQNGTRLFKRGPGGHRFRKSSPQCGSVNDIQ